MYAYENSKLSDYWSSKVPANDVCVSWAGVRGGPIEDSQFDSALDFHFAQPHIKVSTHIKFGWL